MCQLSTAAWQGMVHLAWGCAVLQFRDVSLLAGIADMGEPPVSSHLFA